jgi:hypothetical protein
LVDKIQQNQHYLDTERILLKVIDINEKKEKKNKKIDQISILVSLLSHDFANRLNAIKNQNHRNEAMACILLYTVESMKNGGMAKEEVSKMIEFALKRHFPD